MDKDFVENIQKRVIKLLLTLSNNLQIAAKDQCSEVARLVGCWILENYPEDEVQILKGDLSKELSHDILIVDDGKMMVLIDPTIWQIFSESETIFIGSVRSTSEAVSLLQNKYGGSWGVSEIMQKCDESYQQELLSVIKNNR